MLGVSPGAAVARHVQRYAAALAVDRGRDRLRSPAVAQVTRERPDRRDRDGIGIGCDTPQSWTPPAAPAAKGDQGAVHAQPRSLSQAACARARCCRRRAAPQPGSTSTIRAARVHLRSAAAGGDAGRRLAQQQTEAIAAVLAWLAGHPPTPTAAAGSAAAAARRQARRAAHGDARRTAASPTEPGRAAAASTQPRTGRGGSTPEHPAGLGSQ